MSESGEIDFDKSMHMVRELAASSSFYSDHNILLDLRKTTIANIGMEEAMKICTEFIQCMPSAFKNKIANVVPDNATRAAFAKKLEVCMNLKKINYKVFTEFEHAIEWLSDAKKLK